jgi:predicted SnoaL-like aldol condensation-catalyzing enzyme
MFDELAFELPVVVAGDDGEHVAIVYDTTMTTKDGAATEIGSMEIFRVVNGRIAEVYNCGRKEGRWV